METMMPEKRPGRPRLTDEGQRAVMVSFSAPARLEEEIKLAAAAREQGFSAYLRDVIRLGRAVMAAQVAQGHR